MDIHSTNNKLVFHFHDSRDCVNWMYDQISNLMLYQFHNKLIVWLPQISNSKWYHYLVIQFLVHHMLVWYFHHEFILRIHYLIFGPLMKILLCKIYPFFHKRNVNKSNWYLVVLSNPWMHFEIHEHIQLLIAVEQNKMQINEGEMAYYVEK